MKFTVNKSVFMNVLTPAMGSISTKNSITSIEGVLIETKDDGNIQISTYDMNKGVRAFFTPTSIEREGKYIINAQRLYQTLKVLPDDDITIDINENLNCQIYSGKANFSIFAMRGEDFPSFPELFSDRGFEISSLTLKKMIIKVQHSVAVQDNRAMLMGAYFKINSEGMEVVSCDSYTLSKCNIKCEVSSLNKDGSDASYSFLIPGHALSELIKILPDDEDYKCLFYLSRKHAIVRCDDIIFFTRTIDSEYIDYNRIIPKDNDINVTLNRERLLSALERANLIAEEKGQTSRRSYVKLKVDYNSLIITSSSQNGKVIDEMDAIHEGNDIEIAFNGRYLLNSIRVAEGENVKITLVSPTKAITIVPTEKSEEFDYLYMILPMRMNEEK